MIRPEKLVSLEAHKAVLRARERMPRRINRLKGFEVGGEHKVSGVVSLVVSGKEGAPEDSGTEFVLSTQAALLLAAALATAVAEKDRC